MVGYVLHVIARSLLVFESAQRGNGDTFISHQSHRGKSLPEIPFECSCLTIRHGSGGSLDLRDIVHSACQLQSELGAAFGFWLRLNGDVESYH